MTTVTIDLTNHTTAGESLARLDPGQREQLLEAVRAAVCGDMESDVLDNVRAVLDEEYWWVSETGARGPQVEGEPDVMLMPLPVGVVFGTYDYDNGNFLTADGRVLFEDGRVEEIDFEIEDLLRDRYGARGIDFTLAVDLRTGELDERDRTLDTIHARFGIKPTPNEWCAATVLLGVRTALADPTPVRVVFPCSDDGFLLAEDARATYADGSSHHVDLSAVSMRLTNDYSHAAAGHPLVVDLLADAVTYFAG